MALTDCMYARKASLKKAFKYIFVSISSFAINNLLNYTFNIILQLEPYLALSLSYIIVVILNFFLLKHLVFKKSSIGSKRLFSYYILLIALFRITEYFFFLVLYYTQIFDYFILLNSILISSAIIKYFLEKKIFEKELKQETAV